MSDLVLFYFSNPDHKTKNCNPPGPSKNYLANQHQVLGSTMLSIRLSILYKNALPKPFC
jgi:hypothetical protein